ncbi:MAG: hypothetical protein ACK4PN_12740 [Allorhizobium sp.]
MVSDLLSNFMSKLRHLFRATVPSATKAPVLSLADIFEREYYPYLRDGDLRGALAVLNTAEHRLGSEITPAVIYQRALVNVDLGDWDAVQRDLTSVYKVTHVKPMLRYYLASLLACGGEIERAQVLFSSGIDVLTGNGSVTDSSIVNFSWSEQHVNESRLDVVEKIAGPCSLVYMVAADNYYFERFAQPLLRCFLRTAQEGSVLHFHVVNPSRHCLGLLEHFSSRHECVGYSTECVDFTDCSESQAKTYYACSRYTALPCVLKHYGAAVVVADIDQLILRPFASVLAPLDKNDVGLLIFESQKHNILSMVSATLSVVKPTPGGMDFAHAMRNYVMNAAREKTNLKWHLDQAALAVAYLRPSETRFATLPTSLIHLTDAPPSAASNDAVFWSITQSIESNSWKLDDEEFKRLATEPT